MAVFTRTEIKQEAKAVLKEQTSPFVLAALIMMAIVFSLSGMAQAFMNGESETFTSMFIGLINVAVSGVLSIGFAGMALMALAGRRVNTGDVFGGFEKLDRSLGIVFLAIIKTFLWSLLLIIPGIIAQYRYAMAYYIILERPDLGVNDALKESSRMMQGHKWDFFVLQLSFILWSLLIVVTFGLATLWVLPYQTLTYVAFYNRIKPQPEVVAEGLNGEYAAGGATEAEAREAINAVMNSNVGVPVIDDEAYEARVMTPPQIASFDDDKAPIVGPGETEEAAVEESEEIEEAAAEQPEEAAEKDAE